MRAFVRSHAAKVTPRSPATRASLALLASAALAGAALPALGLFAGIGQAVSNPSCTSTGLTETCVFSYNGTNNTNGTPINWTVPAGVTQVSVVADGGDGANSSDSSGAGGDGGEVRAMLSNIPATTTLSVFPGAAGTGTSGGTGQAALAIGGSGGGGNGGTAGTVRGGGGGGASTVAVAPLGLAPVSRMLVVAAGGGGGASNASGGDGGTGRHPDGDGGNGTYGGGGGTDTGGGAAGTSNLLACASPSMQGLQLLGGQGAGKRSLLFPACLFAGGGGGGGYYGGGGGGGGVLLSGAGGGGSSFAATSAVGGITVTPNNDHQTWSRGNGQVTISFRLMHTSTSVSCLPNPSDPGAPVTCTATISPSAATGTVNFENGSTTIGTCSARPVTGGTATCTTSSLPSGSNTITAYFTPTANSAYQSSQGSTAQVVATPTTTTLSSAPNPSSYGEQVTLTATVSPTDGGGTVDFTYNSTTISGCASQSLVDHSGVYSATCSTSTLPVGSDPLSAVYSGDTLYTGSTGHVNQHVNAASTRLRANLVVHANGTYTLLATLTSGRAGVSGQSVTFVAGRNGPTLCTATTNGLGLASCALTRSQTGTLLHYDGAFTARYAGNATYGPSSDYYPGIPWF